MRREIVVDDITGEDGAHPHTFSLNGQQYSIDLVDATAKRLSDALAPFIDKAQKLSRSVHTPNTARATARINGKPSADLVALRAWAQANGVNVPKRGRIPQSVKDRFDEWSRTTAGRMTA